MATSPETTAFDRGVNPVLKIVLPERAQTVVNFRPDPALEDRIDELAHKSTEGALSPDEQAEYAGYVRANKFIGVLKRQAQRLLSPAAGDHE
jgi:hypothetical protein